MSAPDNPHPGRREVLALAARALVVPTLAGALAAPLTACADLDATVPPGRVGGRAQLADVAPRTPIAPGATTVALLLPLSAPGGAGAAGQAIRNAASMAMAEVVNGAFELDIRDDLGTPAGAAAAASAARAEGARLVLGPLFSPSVAAAASVARPAGLPIIAFSSDAGVAGSGVFLLAFMPQSDVERIVGYAVGTGRRSFAALIPRSTYGSVVEAAFRDTVARQGAQVAGIVSADPGQIQAAAGQVAALVNGGADALFVPASGETLPGIGRALAAAGVRPGRVPLLGTGVWDDPRVFAEPSLQGGLYAAPDSAGFQRFAGRYRGRYGADPVRLASMGYDAVSLVAALIRTRGPDAFSAATLTSPSGFNGIDGAFRFRPDGSSQRSLAVLRLTSRGGEIVSPAPKLFTA